MRDVKGSAQVRAGALIVGATGLAPPIVSSLAVRAMSGPRMFNLVVSNVPGPQQTFYLAGVPLLRGRIPAVPLNPRNQALSIGIVSYDGGVGFGLLADRDALPDLDDAAAGFGRGGGAAGGGGRASLGAQALDCRAPRGCGGIWQTRGVQVAVSFRPWRFESSHPHSQRASNAAPITPRWAPRRARRIVVWPPRPGRRYSSATRRAGSSSSAPPSAASPP